MGLIEYFGTLTILNQAFYPVFCIFSGTHLIWQRFLAADVVNWS